MSRENKLIQLPYSTLQHQKACAEADEDSSHEIKHVQSTIKIGSNSKRNHICHFVEYKYLTSVQQFALK